MKKLDVVFLIVFVIAVIALMIIGACSKDIIFGIIGLMVAIVSLGAILFQNKKKE